MYTWQIFVKNIYIYDSALIQNFQLFCTKMKALEVVLLAKSTIPLKTKIDSGMIEKQTIAQEYVHPSAILDAKLILGKYSKERILQGEQILKERIFEPEKVLFSYQIPKGMVATTIKVDDIEGVSHLIKPGDYIDVLVFYAEKTIESSSSKTIYPDITKLVLNNMLVLAVGQEDHWEKDEKIEVEEEEKEVNITLAVSPEEAEKLILGDEVGRIRLALRHPEDKSVHSTSGIVPRDIIPEKGKFTTGK